ncbi:MAG: hypothetical protein LRY57_03315, partial [Alphaproteobacteria bacterium]|nr:hypothetical protein [Alphaproteobacteria bacterium]
MSKLPLMPSRLMIAVCSAALLTSCGLPSPIPAGYTYHHQTYKSPPGPEAEDVGYDFSVAANHKAVQAWRDIASDLLAKLESGYVFQGRDVTVIPPLGVDQMNKSLDYALHDAFVGKGYKLRAYAKDVPGVAVTMHPLIGDEKAAYEKDRKDYAASHGFKPEDVMGVSILLEVREGAKLVHQTRGVYSIPNFGYDPEFNRQHEYRLMPVAGKA